MNKWENENWKIHSRVTHVQITVVCMCVLPSKWNRKFPIFDVYNSHIRNKKEDNGKSSCDGIKGKSKRKWTFASTISPILYFGFFKWNIINRVIMFYVPRGYGFRKEKHVVPSHIFILFEINHPVISVQHFMFSIIYDLVLFWR